MLPSEWEAYGFVLLEAMAARTPIVATAVGAVPEVLAGGRYGLLVPYGDLDGLARALVEVTEDIRGAGHRSDAGWDHVQQMDWSASAEQFRTLYREVVGG